jgi:hypothetical protein
MVAWYWLIVVLVVGAGVGYGCRGWINTHLRETKEKIGKKF